MPNAHESGEDYSPLIERIKEVFAGVPYPGDDNIISTPEHVAVCDECHGLYTSLVGRRWPELLEDESLSGEVSHAMSFFSPAGWHYYLPVYLIQSIEGQVFSSIYFRLKSDPKLIEFWEERISRMTADQCRVVIAYLLVVYKEDRSSHYSVEQNKAAVEHWKENYQKALSRKL